TSRYYTNKDNNLIGIIEALPHYEDFKDQQFTLLDLKNQKTYNYKIHTNSNPFEESINHFVFDGNKLFLFTQTMKWAKFEYNKTNDSYEKIELKSFLPDNFLKTNERVDIYGAYYNNNICYLLLTKDPQDISKYYVASINTQTGDLIAIKIFAN